MNNTPENPAQNPKIHFPASGNLISDRDLTLIKLLAQEILKQKHRDELGYK